MKTSRLRKLPAAVSVGSFIIILILLLSTNPLISSGVILAFFGLLLILLLSLVKALLDADKLKRQNAKRMAVAGVAIISALMLKSARSLDLLDFVSLLLIGFGLFIYTSRRH